jgi:hypothetical protein
MKLNEIKRMITENEDYNFKERLLKFRIIIKNYPKPLV